MMNYKRLTSEDKSKRRAWSIGKLRDWGIARNVALQSRDGIHPMAVTMVTEILDVVLGVRVVDKRSNTAPMSVKGGN